MFDEDIIIVDDRPAENILISAESKVAVVPWEDRLPASLKLSRHHKQIIHALLSTLADKIVSSCKNVSIINNDVDDMCSTVCAAMAVAPTPSHVDVHRQSPFVGVTSCVITRAFVGDVTHDKHIIPNIIITSNTGAWHKTLKAHLLLSGARIVGKIRILKTPEALTKLLAQDEKARALMYMIVTPNVFDIEPPQLVIIRAIYDRVAPIPGVNAMFTVSCGDEIDNSKVIMFDAENLAASMALPAYREYSYTRNTIYTEIVSQIESETALATFLRLGGSALPDIITMNDHHGRLDALSLKRFNDNYEEKSCQICKVEFADLPSKSPVIATPSCCNIVTCVECCISGMFNAVTLRHSCANCKKSDGRVAFVTDAVTLYRGQMSMTSIEYVLNVIRTVMDIINDRLDDNKTRRLTLPITFANKCPMVNMAVTFAADDSRKLIKGVEWVEPSHRRFALYKTCLNADIIDAIVRGSVPNVTVIDEDAAVTMTDLATYTDVIMINVHVYHAGHISSHGYTIRPPSENVFNMITLKTMQSNALVNALVCSSNALNYFQCKDRNDSLTIHHINYFTGLDK